MSARRTAPSETTQAALLAAASEIFADQGYAVARVKDIAERAGTPVSAINYQFGGKEGLYRAVLEQLTSNTIVRYPLRPEELADAPPEERFRAMVRNLLRRFATPGTPSLLARIMAREMANPTEAWSWLAPQVALPQFQLAAPVVGELLGPEADFDTLRRCLMSVLGQCLFYLFARPLVSRLFPETYADEAALDALAEHIADFSLHAFKALRDQKETP